MKSSASDRIEKQVVLRSPQSRVWRALTDSKEFGQWFRVAMDNRFAPGLSTTGRVTYPGFEHIKFQVLVERMDAEHYFSFFWHPFAIDPEVDYSAEPPTKVEFHLETVADGTRLRVVESGFDQIPAARRAEAFRMNSSGWETQVENIRRHVDR